jgi:hypothetical protein
MMGTTDEDLDVDTRVVDTMQPDLRRFPQEDAPRRTTFRVIVIAATIVILGIISFGTWALFLNPTSSISYPNEAELLLKKLVKFERFNSSTGALFDARTPELDLQAIETACQDMHEDNNTLRETALTLKSLQVPKKYMQESEVINAYAAYALDHMLVFLEAMESGLAHVRTSDELDELFISAREDYLDNTQFIKVSKDLYRVALHFDWYYLSKHLEKRIAATEEEEKASSREPRYWELYPNNHKEYISTSLFEAVMQENRITKNMPLFEVHDLLDGVPPLVGVVATDDSSGYMAWGCEDGRAIAVFFDPLTDQVSDVFYNMPIADIEAVIDAIVSGKIGKTKDGILLILEAVAVPGVPDGTRRSLIIGE